MNKLKNLFFTFILSIFLVSCGSLGIGDKTPVETAQERFENLENQYEELLSFKIDSHDLEKLQERYEILSLKSQKILTSQSSELAEKKLSKKDQATLMALNKTISKRLEILEDLKD